VSDLLVLFFQEKRTEEDQNHQITDLVKYLFLPATFKKRGIQEPGRFIVTLDIIFSHLKNKMKNFCLYCPHNYSST